MSRMNPTSRSIADPDPGRIRPRDIRPASIVAFLVLLACTLPGCDGAGGDPTAASTATIATFRVGIEGMHCDSCVQAITAKVAKVTGVRTCVVDLEGGSATVDAAPEAMPSVRDAIGRLGFTVREIGPAGSAESLPDPPSDPGPAAEADAPDA